MIEDIPESQESRKISFSLYFNCQARKMTRSWNTTWVFSPSSQKKAGFLALKYFPKHKQHWNFFKVLGQFIFLLISENIPSRNVRLLHVTVHVPTNLICHCTNITIPTAVPISNTKFLISANAQLHGFYYAEYCAWTCYDTPTLSPWGLHS